MAESEHEFKWTPLWVGLGVLFASSWFAVLYMLLRKSTASPVTVNVINGQVQPQLGGGFNGTFGFPELPQGQPQPAYVAKTPEIISMEPSPQRMGTFTLPTEGGARVMTAASNRRWRARLRVIGPPGSRALVADSANNLNFPSSCATIPAGDEIELYVNPRAGLFAIGDTPGVVLSVNAGEG